MSLTLAQGVDVGLAAVADVVGVLGQRDADALHVGGAVWGVWWFLLSRDVGMRWLDG